MGALRWKSQDLPQFGESSSLEEEAILYHNPVSDNGKLQAVMKVFQFKDNAPVRDNPTMSTSSISQDH